MVTAVKRPVRVTLEGEAYSPAANVLMVVLPSGHKVCLTEGLGIAVEDIEPPRVWTDDDVVHVNVRSGRAYVAHRQNGTWPTTAGGVLQDEHIELVLSGTSDSLSGTVLRYQHGGEQ